MDIAQVKTFQILLGMDGSESSLAAVQLLADLPFGRLGPQKTAITALAVLHIQHHIRRSQLEAVLVETRARLSLTGAEIQTGLVHGNPAGELVHYADQHELDLIVLGALGLRATLGILLGGVAQQIVEYAHCPVLIVRAPYQGFRKVLLASDGSASSEKAINYLCGCGSHACLPLPEASDLHLVHVLPPLIQPEIYMRTWPVEALPQISVEELEETSRLQAAEEERSGRELIERTAGSLGEAMGGRMTGRLETALLRGDAATEIIRYVKDHDIDLIIAGSRGLSEVRSWLLGSVSRKLVHYAGCSVLVVK